VNRQANGMLFIFHLLRKKKKAFLPLKLYASSYSSGHRTDAVRNCGSRTGQAVGFEMRTFAVAQIIKDL